MAYHYPGLGASFSADTNRVWLDNMGYFAHFTDRSKMVRTAPLNKFAMPAQGSNLPTIPLPIDGTNNAKVLCPMDGNDQYGICGPAMCEHMYNIWTYGQGKPGFEEKQDVLADLIKQYLKISGGDNGTNESMLVGNNGAWKTGLAYNVQNIVVDALDIDVTNVNLTQYAIENFYGVCMAWSVPNAFMSSFKTGAVFSGAGRPNPANGHYTPLADVGGPSSANSLEEFLKQLWDLLAVRSSNVLSVAAPEEVAGANLNGYYRLWSWGTWCWVAPEYIASVDPETFVAFSPRQFNSLTGCDSKGRHITQQAAIWQQCGGHPISQMIINQFPPYTPTPTPIPPTPTPIPPTPTPVPIPDQAFQGILMVTAPEDARGTYHFVKVPDAQ